MRFKSLFLFLLFFCFGAQGQTISGWKRVGDASAAGKRTNITESKGFQLYQFDQRFFKDILISKQEKKLNSKGVSIGIPNMNGDLENFIVLETSNFNPELQAKYPDIKSYSGIGVSDPTASLFFSFSPIGIQTMVLRKNGISEFIEKYAEDPSLYKMFSSKYGNNGRLPFECSTQEKNLNEILVNMTSKITANNKVFKTLRLALSCTGEYAAFYGGTKTAALAGMNATMTRVNGIFNRDLAVKLELIANNDLVIYTNAAIDPYSEASVGVDGPWGTELQNTLTNVIGNGNYDIGHLFGASGGGGNAGCIGCVCVAPSQANPLGKGSAFTSPSDNKPQGDTFDIDFVAHEMGHQLGATHTFSYENEGTGVSVEPGSGSTIMGYAGITVDYDVQSHSDDYFAYASISQIQNNLATKSCPVSTTISNSAPNVNAGGDYTIPKGTPFILKGTASDANGDNLSYTWEQNDSASSTNDGDNSIALPTKTDGPLFRSIYPASSPIRYFPNYNNVLSNKLVSRWESVSNVARTLHFVLTARDNASLGSGQTNSDDMVVNVSGTVGPFEITSQNTDDLSWFQGTKQTITWNVNQTNTLSGSSKVNIKLSTDGGETFPINLALDTANDGSETITVPNVAAKDCRLMIEPAGNIFYAINSKSFAIGYKVSSACNTFTFSTPVAIPESLTYATRTISHPSSSALVSDINLNVSFSHAYLSDVQMDLVSPKGTIVKLFEKSCGDRNGSLSLNYDDNGSDLVCGATTLQTVTPAEPLGTFNGESPAGTWTLRIRDVFKDDTGTLDSASITICSKSFELVPYIAEDNDLILSPNPNDGNFNIKFTSKSTSAKIKITVYDALGKQLYEQEFVNNGDLNENIQLETKPQDGIYFLRLDDGQKQKVAKFIVQ